MNTNTIRLAKSRLPLYMLLAAASPLAVAHAAPKAKPAKPKPAVSSTVMGMVPMAGVEGRMGQTYTLEDGNPINFTLKSAEFSRDRVRVGDRVVFANKDEKLLVLRYTLHNPQKAERNLYWGTLQFTAVDATNQNREFEQIVGAQLTGNRIDSDLKPAQRIEAYTVIKVPAREVVPKLIVKPRTGGVIRYDLRNGVKPLPAPFADAGDKSGASAPEEVAAQKDTFYPLHDLDIKLLSATYADDLGDIKPPAGQKFFVATFLMRNGTPTEKRYYWGTLKPELSDTDGEKAEWPQALLKGSRNEKAEGTLKPGEEYKARFYFPLPKDVSAKTFKLSENESHILAFDVSAQ